MNAHFPWSGARAVFALTLVPLAVALVGCVTKTDGDVIPWSEPGRDNDLDGYSPNEGDCDDYEPLVNPDAVEVCDGIDNNCDEVIDADAEDAPTWYIDYDGDTYGGSSAYDVVSCDQPEGYVSDGTDCDDDEPLVNPKADEICDGIDNNCDELVDEDAVDESTLWYIDADGDGWGTDEYTIKQCTQPKGYVIELGDCDDLDVEVNPDAEEVCDEVDNNCNDSIDEDVIETFYLDLDGDGYGVEGDSEVIEGCEAPAGYTINPGDDFDCDDGDAWIHPGAAELCDGADNDCDEDTTDEDRATWFTEKTATDLSIDLGGGTASVAVEFSVDDDGELRFCDGTWFVNLEIDGAEVSVTSLNGADVTTLDGAGTGSVLTVQSGANLTLDGLTVTHGEASQGAGLYLSYANATVHDAIITENDADDDGGGVYVSGAVLDISNTTITENIATNNGGGLYVYGGSEVTMDDVIVLSNGAGGDGGGMYAYAISTVSLEDSTITNNTAGEDGAGMVAGYSTLVSFDGVSLSENDAGDDGGGIYLFGFAELASLDSGITGNSALNRGGGMLIYDAEADLNDTNLSTNDAAEGGGAYLDSAAVLDASDCFVGENNPEDIKVLSGVTYDYGGTSSFECDEDACQ